MSPGPDSASLPAPPVPPDAYFGDHPFVPIYRARLLSSAIYIRGTAEEFRSSTSLILNACDQIPAGSLPNDDVELTYLAGLGRNQRAWKKVKAMALSDWVLCNDGRLYHPPTCEAVMAVEEKRAVSSRKGKAGALARWGRDHGTSNARAMPQPSLLHGTSNAPAIKADASAIPRDGTGTGRAMPAAMPGDSKLSEVKLSELRSLGITQPDTTQRGHGSEARAEPRRTGKAWLDDTLGLLRREFDPEELNQLSFDFGGQLALAKAFVGVRFDRAAARVICRDGAQVVRLRAKKQSIDAALGGIDASFSVEGVAA